MNNDLISRSALLDSLRLMAKYQPEHKASTILGVCETIKAWSVVDAEPVRHGKWESCFEDWRQQIEGVKCSACGSEYYITAINCYNYCPSCGAKMDGEDDGIKRKM